MCLEWAWYMTDMLIEDYDNDDFHYTDKYRLKMIKSLVYFGAVVSAGPAAFFASLLGFKSVLVIGMMITACGSLVIIYLSTTSIAFCIGRIMHGIGTGIVFVIVPNYAAEIAEPKLRCEYYIFSKSNIQIVISSCGKGIFSFFFFFFRI